MKHVTILGIDGAGKSTIIQKILKNSSFSSKSYSIINSPAFHEGIDAPFKELSKELEHLSNIADEMGEVELKAMALYLQVSLFGIVEKNFKENWQPKLLISQRHPVLDSVVYGDLYQKMIKGPINQKKVEETLKKNLDQKSASWDRILHWFELLATKLELPLDFWNFPIHLKKIFENKNQNLILELMKHYQTTLPDVVILIDINSELALSRVESRSGEKKELHESTAYLKILSENYHRLMLFLESSYPQIERITLKADSADYEKINWQKLFNL